MWKKFFGKNTKKNQTKNSNNIDASKIPQHIAIIMDGNGRWAQNKGLMRTFGHRAGVGVLKDIVKTASDIGVKHLTVYAFSTENWKRPQDEVDFLMNGNSFEYVHTLDKIYKRDADKNKAKEKLETNSVEVAGAEVLRIADKQGKGWLALLVAEQLVYNTYIPKYILQAIAWASSHINTSSKIKAISFRLKAIKGNNEDKMFEVACKFKMRGKGEEEIIKTFLESFPNDQLTQFLNYL